MGDNRLPVSSTHLEASNSQRFTQGQRHDRFEEHGVSLGEPTEEDGDVPISLYQKMLSAVAGSLITSLLVTPLDVVRVRLQSQQPPSSFKPSSNLPQAYSFTNAPPNLGISACCREVFWVSNNAEFCVASPNVSITENAANKSVAACAAEETRRKTFTSTFDGLRKIAQNEGPLTLWRGLSPTLVMAIPGNVIYFAGYDWLRYSRRSPFLNMPINETYIPLLAGSSARVLAAIAVGPIEMFRTRMQAISLSPGSPRGSYMTETFRGLKELISIRGYRSLWTGLSLTLWRDVPFSAVYWWGYEAGREHLRDFRLRQNSQLSGSDLTRPRTGSNDKQLQSETHSQVLVDSFVAGASSGAFAALITTPFDVGKTRQQVVRYSTKGSSANSGGRTPLPEELNMPRFLWHIFKTEGMNGLFRGWAPRCLKVAPACAIMISSYEIGKKMAGGMNEMRQSSRNPI